MGTIEPVSIVGVLVDLADNNPTLTTFSFARTYPNGQTVDDLLLDTWLQPHPSHCVRTGLSGRKIFCDSVGVAGSTLLQPFSYIFNHLTPNREQQFIPKSGHVVVVKHAGYGARSLTLQDIDKGDLGTIYRILDDLISEPAWAVSLITHDYRLLGDRRFLQDKPHIGSVVRASVHEPGDIPRPWDILVKTWDIPFQGSYPLGSPMDCTLGHPILYLMGLGTSQGLQWNLGCPNTPVLGVGHPNSFLSMVGCPNFFSWDIPTEHKLGMSQPK
ncbi:hypothetical protein K435DRAFT_810735 [Dendrothele bispora CBS 962.96]|uniref:Uncharacterized protein n=1 Tax=Dendrothele bispora (strain CBS 962.96) TaxID=1314807 RepID=A0A4S8KU89_DENBC|nr:hypothetical protein K435DRAFT_810735 [Dendrothele bispora CBS 962.96]